MDRAICLLPILSSFFNCTVLLFNKCFFWIKSLVLFFNTFSDVNSGILFTFLPILYSSLYRFKFSAIRCPICLINSDLVILSYYFFNSSNLSFRSSSDSDRLILKFFANFFSTSASSLSLFNY